MNRVMMTETLTSLCYRGIAIVFAHVVLGFRRGHIAMGGIGRASEPCAWLGDGRVVVHFALPGRKPTYNMFCFMDHGSVRCIGVKEADMERSHMYAVASVGIRIVRKR